MTPFEKLIEVLADLRLSFDLWGVFKILILLILLFYIAFGIAVLRQVGLMSKALNGALDVPVKVMAFIHLGLIVLLFVLALLAL